MFSKKLNKAINEKNSRVCVGLDPRLELLPLSIRNKAKKKFGLNFQAAASAIIEFNKKVIDVVTEEVPAVKLQIAFYEQYGVPGMDAFQKTIEYAKKCGLIVIVDAKRGDIDSTAQAYANSLLGKTDIFGVNTSCFDVDCITVNPFLGKDSLKPFVDTAKEFRKGIFILVKTSNPGSVDLQDLMIEGKSVSERMAEFVDTFANNYLDEDGYSGIGAVVGATYPNEARYLRGKMSHSIFLVPGVGAQGGNVDDIANFFNPDGLGAIINSSRGIVFSGEENDDNFQKVILTKTKELKLIINKSINK